MPACAITATAGAGSAAISNLRISAPIRSREIVSIPAESAAQAAQTRMIQAQADLAAAETQQNQAAVAAAEIQETRAALAAAETSLRQAQAEIENQRTQAEKLAHQLAKSFLVLYVRWDTLDDVDLHLTDPSGAEFWWDKHKTIPGRPGELSEDNVIGPVSYTHLTLPTNREV